MKFLLRLLINAGALLLIAYYLPGFGVDSLYAAIVAAIVLGLINAILRPVIVLLTLPVNLLTLGLFSFIINAGLFWLVSTIVKGFTVEGFVPALFGSLAMSVIGWFTGWLLKK